MKKILRKVYGFGEKTLSGKGLDKYLLITKSAKFLRSNLKMESIEIDGHLMYLDPLDSLRLSINGIYEEFATMIVKKIIKKGDVVIDLGANIGYYTLIFARIVGENGKAYAFEPEPLNVSLLKKNVEVNGYENVIIVNKAISNKTEKIKLYIDDENQGGHTLSATNTKSKSIQIETVTLDNYFKKGSNKIKFIKMDIEGSEARAIDGMQCMLKNNNELQMMTEFNPYLLNKSGTDPEKYLYSLMKFDYKIFEIDRKKRKVLRVEIPQLLSKYTQQNQKHANLLFLKHNIDNKING